MSWSPYNPCPNCGEQGDNFRQVIQQVEDVELDSDGDPKNFDVVNGSFEIVAVACKVCDTTVFGDDYF